MKFDYDQAWNDTVTLVRDNLGLLAIIGGIFFFLPYAALSIALPEMAAFTQVDPADSEAMMAAMMDFYRGYWWIFLLMGVLQGIGILAMLALLKRRANPTVGEALKTGVVSVLPYLAAGILQSLFVAVVAGVLIGIPVAAGSTGLAAIGGLIALVMLIYIWTKLSLVAPVMAIEEMLNPIKAIMRSWLLTKGNSIRLFFFYLLIFVAFLVVSVVLSIVLTFIFALGGEQTALIGSSMVSALINAGFIILIVGILAAVYTQLARLRAEPETDEPA